jgi:eukaryotic-like serine/threonine-protein kinase
LNRPASERWKRVEFLYDAALQRPGGERAAFLSEACAGDEALRLEVESLLAQPVSDAGFLATPALAVAARDVGPRSSGALLVAGHALGPYTILGLLGAGGMGEVYRARDSQLGREVALKMLPAVFLKDPDRLARFERESRVLASLNHPNIAAIYAVEPIDAGRALVLELVEGPTLAERLARGRVPLDEALRTSMQIADALEAAHEKGIVHRDLKPANIKLRPDGTVKVLDFGLAKAAATDGSSPDLTKSPTMSAGGTGDRVIGTPAYMSPEQARGQAVDKRTDIWAFGCVLFEMLTGRPAFSGPTVTDTLAAIIEREPDWASLAVTNPVGLQRLLRRCLEKDPKRRLRDIGDARVELDEIARGGADPVMQPRHASNRRRLWVTSAALLALGLVAIVGTAAFLRRASDSGPATRLSVTTPGVIAENSSVVVSPDGRALAFVMTDASGKSMLWLRALDQLGARALPGTEGARFPFWSPDGRFLGFSTDRHLKKVDVRSGNIDTLGDAPGGLTWSTEGLILCGSSEPGQFRIVDASSRSAVTTVSPAVSGSPQPYLRWPQFLPDGRHFLYYVPTPVEERGVYIGSIDSTDTKRVLKTDFKALYTAPGYLLFMRDDALMAQPFDTARFELTGKPIQVADGIWNAVVAGQADFSASENGVLAYVNLAILNRQWAWHDRTGRLLERFGSPDRVGSLRLSPDGTRVAVSRGPIGREDIWLMSATGADASQITFEPESERSPAWLADGKSLAYNAIRDPDQQYRVYQKDLEGARSERRLLDAASSNINDVSRDGRFVVYVVTRPLSDGGGLWVMPLLGDRKPYLFRGPPRGVKGQAEVSPDGRWLAYASNELGRDEVFIQTFPQPGGLRRVSVDGGFQPRWRNDGQELFYFASDQTLMSVPVRNQTTLEMGQPTPLFRPNVSLFGPQSTPTMYEVSPDGQRFLLPGPPSEAVPPITVVLNWTAALKQ